MDDVSKTVPELTDRNAGSILGRAVKILLTPLPRSVATTTVIAGTPFLGAVWFVYCLRLSEYLSGHVTLLAWAFGVLGGGSLSGVTAIYLLMYFTKIQDTAALLRAMVSVLLFLYLYAHYAHLFSRSWR